MFTTYPRAEIALGPADGPGPDGERVWSFVEQELLLPWLYLQVVRRVGRETYSSMFMMYHAHELKHFIDAQSSRVWVEHVQLVTPPYMNGRSTWMMEPLATAGIFEDPRDGSHFVAFKVTSGESYSLRDDVDLSLTPINVLFSRERDLRAK